MGQASPKMASLSSSLESSHNSAEQAAHLNVGRISCSTTHQALGSLVTKLLQLCQRLRLRMPFESLVRISDAVTRSFAALGTCP